MLLAAGQAVGTAPHRYIERAGARPPGLLFGRSLTDHFQLLETHNWGNQNGRHGRHLPKGHRCFCLSSSCFIRLSIRKSLLDLADRDRWGLRDLPSSPFKVLDPWARWGCGNLWDFKEVELIKFNNKHKPRSSHRNYTQTADEAISLRYSWSLKIVWKETIKSMKNLVECAKRLAAVVYVSRKYF